MNQMACRRRRLDLSTPQLSKRSSESSATKHGAQIDRLHALGRECALRVVVVCSCSFVMNLIHMEIQLENSSLTGSKKLTKDAYMRLVALCENLSRTTDPSFAVCARPKTFFSRVMHHDLPGQGPAHPVPRRLPSLRSARCAPPCLQLDIEFVAVGDRKKPTDFVDKGVTSRPKRTFHYTVRLQDNPTLAWKARVGCSHSNTFYLLTLSGRSTSGPPVWCLF